MHSLVQAVRNLQPQLAQHRVPPLEWMEGYVEVAWVRVGL